MTEPKTPEEKLEADRIKKEAADLKKTQKAEQGKLVSFGFFKPGDKEPTFPHEHAVWDRSDLLLLMRKSGAVVPGHIYKFKMDYERGHIKRKEGDLLFNTHEDQAITDVVGWAELPTGK